MPSSLVPASLDSSCFPLLDLSEFQVQGVEIDPVGLKQRLGVPISNQFPGSVVATVLRTVFFSIGPHIDHVLLTQKQRKEKKMESSQSWWCMPLIPLWRQKQVELSVQGQPIVSSRIAKET